MLSPGSEGYLCSSHSWTKGCSGPDNLNDNVEVRIFLLFIFKSGELDIDFVADQAVIVRPGCTLEAWDEYYGLEEAKLAETKGKNAANYRNTMDIFHEKKVVFTAYGENQYIDDLDTDFDDINEEFESFRYNAEY